MYQHHSGELIVRFVCGCVSRHADVASGKNGIGAIRCVRIRTRIRHTDTANRIATCSDSKRIHTRNHDQFTGVILIHGLSPQVSRGRALKSFRMLLDRRQ